MTITVAIKDKAINTTYHNMAGTTVSGPGITGIVGGTNIPVAVSGTGAGALFDVTKTDGNYAITLTNGGANYLPGDTITMLGSKLGGVNGTNDITVTIKSIDAKGAISTFSTIGVGRVGDGVLDTAIGITGTAGLDTFSIQGASTDFNTAKIDANTIEVTSKNVNMYADFTNYERITFADKAKAFDVAPNENAGITYALEAAAVGLKNMRADWIGAGLQAKDTGLTEEQLAQGIIDSEVWKSLVSGTSDETVMKHIFKNVIGREATAADMPELMHWMHGNNYTQAQALVAASHFAEIQDVVKLIGQSGQGIDYIPLAA